MAPAVGGDPHPDAQGEGDPDAEQAEHEQPVGPGVAGDAVVEVLERAVRAELRKPSVGLPPLIQAASPNRSRLPSSGRAGVVAQGEKLVEERPQERQPEGDAQQGQRPRAKVVGAVFSVAGSPVRCPRAGWWRSWCDPAFPSGGCSCLSASRDTGG